MGCGDGSQSRPRRWSGGLGTPPGGAGRPTERSGQRVPPEAGTRGERFPTGPRGSRVCAGSGRRRPRGLRSERRRGRAGGGGGGERPASETRPRARPPAPLERLPRGLAPVASRPAEPAPPPREPRDPRRSRAAEPRPGLGTQVRPAAPGGRLPAGSGSARPGLPRRRCGPGRTGWAIAGCAAAPRLPAGLRGCAAVAAAELSHLRLRGGGGARPGRGWNYTGRKREPGGRRGSGALRAAPPPGGWAGGLRRPPAFCLLRVGAGGRPPWPGRCRPDAAVLGADRRRAQVGRGAGAPAPSLAPAAYIAVVF